MNNQHEKTRNPQSAIRNRNDGFTLIEIMVALALLGGSLMLLLDSHYSASLLFSEAQDAFLMQGFIERAISVAEIAARAGLQNGAGDFGEQYPGYTFSWRADPYGPVEGLPLMEVVATVNGPVEERSATMLVYLTSTPSP